MTEQEIRDPLAALQKERMAKQEEETKKLGEKNRKEGEAFLAANKKKEGVKTLASGLQYKVIKPGTGKKPKSTDTVTTHYRGTLIEGTEFRVVLPDHDVPMSATNSPLEMLKEILPRTSNRISPS